MQDSSSAYAQLAIFDSHYPPISTYPGLHVKQAYSLQVLQDSSQYMHRSLTNEKPD